MCQAFDAESQWYNSDKARRARMSNDPNKVTNQFIRRALGEAGFIVQVAPTYEDAGGKVSTWMRGLITLRLFEYHDNSQPRLFNLVGDEVTVEQLGVRNENIQNDGSPDE